ncbi:MAG: ABC transporter substrate-binding protein [Thermoleophilia bacterium]
MIRTRIAGVCAGLAAVAAALAGAGCGGGGGDGRTLRLGYLANITNGPALVGIQQKIFTDRIPGMKVKTEKFATGTEAVAAMLSGSIDASYFGMGPVITTLSRAPGTSRVISGAGQSGAVLVVRTGLGIHTLRDLRGRNVAFPGYGNTQDLTLRRIVTDAALTVGTGHNDIHMVRVRNADLKTAFTRGALEGAMVPEPWGTQLVSAGLAEVLIPADRVMDGTTPTTVLVVRTAFAKDHPEQVRQLLEANRQAVQVARDPGAVADAYMALVKSNKLSRDTLIQADRANIPTTAINRSGAQGLLEAAQDAGYLAKPVRLDQLLPPQ